MNVLVCDSVTSHRTIQHTMNCDWSLSERVRYLIETRSVVLVLD